MILLYVLSRQSFVSGKINIILSHFSSRLTSIDTLCSISGPRISLLMWVFIFIGDRIGERHTGRNASQRERNLINNSYSYSTE